MLSPSFRLNWIGGWSLTELSGSLLGDGDEGLLGTLEVALTQDQEPKENLTLSQTHSALAEMHTGDVGGA